ncbi:hypothetical protein XHC_4164 [Xanthomonas hortorum pv. carotae str. M081]|nr:hypothetical protein XHC_4164 [Xanthomonas hortorum pv. carotae str. M081]
MRAWLRATQGGKHMCATSEHDHFVRCAMRAAAGASSAQHQQGAMR